MIAIPAALLSPRTILVSAVVATVFYGGWAVRGHFADAKVARIEAAHAKVVSAAAEKLRKAEADARAREAALIEKTKGIVDEARSTVQALEAQIGRADSASRGLLDAGRRAANRCTANSTPAPAGGGAGSSVSGGMSDGDRWLRVLGELDGFAGAAAEDSGRARAARDVCQRYYEEALRFINRGQGAK